MMSDKLKIIFQRRGLDALMRQGEPKFTEKWFSYTSGQVGLMYIQSVAIENNGRDYYDNIGAMAKLVNDLVGSENYDVVSGGESRDWDFSNPTAVKVRRPHAKLYDPSKTKKHKILGANVNGKRVVHVADLNNEGSSMRDKWNPMIKAAGGKIVYSVFFVDRMEEGTQVMKDLGIPSTSVVPLDAKAWQYLLDKNYISKDLYNSLNKRMENIRLWGQNALRKHPEGLIDLLQSPDTIRKGEKILNVGYPEIREELIYIMKRKGYVHTFTEAKNE